MATSNLVSYERNEKTCPEKKPSKEELAAIARDENEANEKEKEDTKNGLIARIIAFWISVWTWLPRTMYNVALQAYNSLFGPEPPCPTGGEAPAPEPVSVPAPEPVTGQAPVTAPEPVTAPAPAVPATGTEAQRTGLAGGGRKRDLLRKINNLKRSLKHRSK